MNKILPIVGIIIFITIIISAAAWYDLDKAPNNGSNLNWSTDLGISLQEAQKSNKPIFIDFYTNWCTYCRQMDRETFSDQRIQDKLTQNYILVKIDLDQNPELSSQYKIYSLPTLLFLDPQGNEIKRLDGFQTPEQLLNQL